MLYKLIINVANNGYLELSKTEAVPHHVTPYTLLSLQHTLIPSLVLKRLCHLTAAFKIPHAFVSQASNFFVT